MVEPSIGRHREPPSLLVVGAATRDIDASDARGWRLGGTVAYASLAAARLGMRVNALIGVDREAAGADELELLPAAGVDLQPVHLDRGPVFENIATPSGRTQFAHQASDPMPITALPGDWNGFDAVLLGPVAGELDEEWQTVASAPALIGLAWQGLLRKLVPTEIVARKPPSFTALVKRADLIVVGADDLGADGEEGLVIRDEIRPGQEMAITHGDRGGIHLRKDGSRLRVRLVPTLPPVRVVDTVGAGDVFLAAWLSARLLLQNRSVGDPWRPLAMAAAMASLTVEGRGLAGLPDRSQVCERIIRLRDRRLG